MEPFPHFLSPLPCCLKTGCWGCCLDVWSPVEGAWVGFSKKKELPFSWSHWHKESYYQKCSLDAAATFASLHITHLFCHSVNPHQLRLPSEILHIPHLLALAFCLSHIQGRGLLGFSEPCLYNTNWWLLLYEQNMGIHVYAEKGKLGYILRSTSTFDQPVSSAQLLQIDKIGLESTFLSVGQNLCTR